MPQYDLAIIIISWNVRDLLRTCIQSILNNIHGLTYRITVVDNASSDGTIAMLQNEFPDVLCLRNIENVGFASANNQALRESQARHVLLLNPDTLVVGDALKTMVEFADTRDEIGLIGPRLQSPDGKIQYVCARSFPTAVNWFWHYCFIGRVLSGNRVFGRLLLSFWDHLDSRAVEAITGAAMLIPKRTLEQVGVLDETHPMYLEDVDYCRRVWMAGKEIWYLSDAVIIHYGGQSSSQVSWKTKLLSLDAHRIFFDRYGSWIDKKLFRPLVVLVSLIRLSVFCFARLASIFRPNGIQSFTNQIRNELKALLWGIHAIKAPKMEAIKA